MPRSSASIAALRSDVTLSEAFATGAIADPDARLVVASMTRPSETRLGDIHARGVRVGAHLYRLDIGPGDVVAVQLPNWVEWTLACIAVAHVGAVLLPIVPIYGARELGFILREARAKMLVTPRTWRGVDYRARLGEAGMLPDLVDHVVVGTDAVDEHAVAWAELEAPIASVAAFAGGADDVALLVYTSGTTADPKGVRHSHRTLLAEAISLFAVRPALKDGAFLSPWPTGHIAGTGVVLRHLIGGVDTVVMDEWNPRIAAALVSAHRVRCCSGTPFHLAGLLDAAAAAGGHDLATLTDFQTGAAAVPPALIARCDAIGLATYRSYGSTEHPTVSFGAASDPLAKRLATEGRLVPGSEVRFVDDEGHDVPAGADGEIVSRGPELFLGYQRAALDKTAFLPGGWYRSGDIGRLDADGYLLVVDRKKDIIIRGGENISSREVEDALSAMPGLIEVAVIPAPDDRMGEVVCAVVVAARGQVVTLETVRAHFAALGLARQKTPEQIVQLDALPRNATGKILKQDLRRMISAPHPEAAILPRR